MAGTEGSPVVEGAPTSEPPHISAGHDNDDSHKAPDADYPSPRPRLSIVSGLVVEKPLTSAMQSHFTAIADGAHIWHEMDSSSMKYCLTCKKRLGFKHGYRCGACKYTVDGRCRERQDITPPCSHKFVLSTDRTAVHEVEHQWIDGNFNLRDCSICRKRIQGGFSVTRPCAVRCAWCKIIAHYECSRTQDQSCTLGKHARLMVPNSSITVILDSSSSSVRGRRAGTPPHSGPSTPQPGPQHQIVAPIAHSCVGVPVRRSSDHGSATASVPTTPQATPQSDDKVTRSESLRSLGSVGSGDMPSSSTSGSAVARTSSLTKSQRRNQRRSMRRRSKNKLGSVIIRTLPDSIPLVVFINPKSGSKQGQKLMKDFQWLLNPVQVFDLTNGGPKTGLSLFADVPNFRILVCGGDGTVGWVLSVLDELNIVPCPPIAVMPLGTGNDLARALKWGGGYSDEDVSPMLTAVEDAEIMPMDRWYLRVTPYHENITSSNGSLHSPSLSPLPQSPTTTAIDGNKSLSPQDTLQTADGGAGGSGASALTSNKLMGMSQSWSGGLDRSDEAGTSNATGGMSLSAMPDTKAHKGKKRRKGKDKDKMAFSPTLTAAQSISSLVDSGAGSPIFEGAGVANLPLNVMNNYFSFGVDAQTVLAFHEAREKNPERFKSRVGNKIYYGLNGLRDMFKHSQRGFAKHVRLECDGVDMTHILEERKLEGLVFLNITSYGSGTDPWGSSKSDGFMPQRMDDGLVEVIGLFSAFDLAKQQARLGKALRIAQCRRARVVTLKDLPVQVDGEPCLLAPSEIIIEHHNCVQMLQRRDNKGDSKEKLMSPQNAHRTANPAVSASLLRSPQQQRPRPASSDVASMVARSDANSSKQPRPHSMALSPSSSYSTIPAFTPTISTATATNPVSVPSIQVTTPPSMPTTTTTITEDAPAAPSAAIAATAAATLAAVSNLEYVPPPAHRGRNASFAAALSNSSPLDSSEV